MSLERAKSEVERVAEEIRQEKSEKDKLISETTISQSLLMAIKREERFGKSKSFNGFVLEQRSRHDSEFFDFLILLKQNVRNLPPGTRIELAVVTGFVGPRDDKNFYDAKLLWQQHWSAVDLYIDGNGHVNSFVLDAANSIGFRGMHARLKANFPEGNHYVYKSDSFIVNQQKNHRRIQTQKQGCSVFVTDHLKQLSQIDSTTLYISELPNLINKMSNDVKLKNFEGKQTKLSRIFRGMQSWSGLNSLGPEILDSPIKETNGKVITLGDYAKSHIDNNGINLTISKKSEKYKSRKSDYFETLSLDMSIPIMLNRQGFTFIKNPSLFEFCSAMNDSRKEDIIHFITSFSHELEVNSFHFSSIHVNKIKENIFKLNELTKTSLDQDINIGKLKNNILLYIASMFKYFDDNNYIKNKYIFNVIFKNSLPLLRQGKFQALDESCFDSNLYLHINKNYETLFDSDGRILSTNQNIISTQNSLQKSNSLNVDDINVATLLWDLEAIKSCLRNGAEVTQIGNDGWTPLMRAANADRFDILKALYEHSPELHKIDIEHMSKAAYLAAKHGHCEVLDFLLKRGVNPNSVATENNETKPLIIAAAENKRFDIIELLLVYGVNLNLADGNGNTLFHVAVNIHDINFIKFLAEQNLNPNIREDNGYSPIYLAALQDPSEERNKIIQTILSSKQIDINAQDENGLTQFHLAAKNGDLSVILVLIELGVELANVVDRKIFHDCISKALLTNKKDMLKIGKSLFLLYKSGILNDCFAKAVIESTQYADSFAEGVVALHESNILTDTIFQELKKHIPHAFSISMALLDLYEYHMLNDKNQRLVFTSGEATDNVHNILRVLKRNDILNDDNFEVSMSSSLPDFCMILVTLNQLNILNDPIRQALKNNSIYAVNILNIFKRIDIKILNEVNFLIIACNAVKIDSSSNKLRQEGMLNDANFQALLNDPDNADKTASDLVCNVISTQRINRLLNIYIQFQGYGFFPDNQHIKAIEMLSDLKKEIAQVNYDDLSIRIDIFKAQGKYKEVFEGRFKDQIQELLDELKTSTPSRQLNIY